MHNPIAGKLSGHLRETIICVYDVRPSTADFIMDVTEAMADLAKSEYNRGRTDMYIAKRFGLAESEDKG